MLLNKENHEMREGRSRSHEHGVVDPSLFTNERGIWAVKISLWGLGATAFFQLIVALQSGSVSLLADTIHNFGDAATAIPLWLAFRIASKPPNDRFTHGYGRFEDLAGLCVLVALFASAAVAGYLSIRRFFHPELVHHVAAVAMASIVGFLGNEGVALFRIKVGREIGSAALVADGYHARVDGLTSLAVLAGVAGVWLGYPLADPIVGLGITMAILVILWPTANTVLARFVDAVDPETTQEIRQTISQTPRVIEVTELRVRWLGHQLRAEVNIAVDPNLSVEEAHHISQEVSHRLLLHLKYLSSVTIHVDPSTASGEKHHRVTAHAHDRSAPHSQ